MLSLPSDGGDLPDSQAMVGSERVGLCFIDCGVAWISSGDGMMWVMVSRNREVS